jgi:hypothetical protein
MLSGNMADILSNLYLGYSLVWYHHPATGHALLRDECLKYLMQEAEYKMHLVICNYPINLMRSFLYPLKSGLEYANFDDKNKFKILPHSGSL